MQNLKAGHAGTASSGLNHNGLSLEPEKKKGKFRTRAAKRWAEPGLVRVKLVVGRSHLTLPPSPLCDGEFSKPGPTSGDASEEGSTIGTDLVELTCLWQAAASKPKAQ